MSSPPVISFIPSVSSADLCAPKVRWVGFDIDDCVGSVMPVYGYCSKIDPTVVAHTIYPFEISGETWLLRPGLTTVIEAVARAYKTHKIHGAFLYSNNNSSKTVEFTKALLNKIAVEAEGVEPFLAAFHRRSAARSSESDKRFQDICNLLHVADLPPPTSTDDILFYDDQVHPLMTEIAHYVRVPKYSARTPAPQVNAALASVPLDSDMLMRVAVYTAIQEDDLPPDTIVYDRPPVDTDVINHFISGLEMFLNPPPSVPVILD